MTAKTNQFFVILDRKSTRLNSSHLVISYAVFCLKKKDTSLVRLTSMKSWVTVPMRLSVTDTQRPAPCERSSAGSEYTFPCYVSESFFFFFKEQGPHQDLPSSPTRRSPV